MDFYGYFRSSAAYRCRIAFNLKCVKPAFKSIHLRSGKQKSLEFLALNPQGLVPALVVNGRVLTQSLAIIEWLEEAHPTPPLLPRDALDRAHVRSLALSIACDIHPLQNLRVLNHLKSEYGQDQAGLDAWCRRWLEPGLAAFEAMLMQSKKSGAFCFGDAPGLADICLVPQMFSATRFGADVSKLANLQRIMKTCEAHSAFADAHPALQPDVEA